jgi:hypothetical protein
MPAEGGHLAIEVVSKLMEMKIPLISVVTTALLIVIGRYTKK